MTNGEDVIAVIAMKPISTLARGLDSVDLETGEPARAAYERSDVSAVPPAASSPRRCSPSFSPTPCSS